MYRFLKNEVPSIGLFSINVEQWLNVIFVAVSSLMVEHGAQQFMFPRAALVFKWPRFVILSPNRPWTMWEHFVIPVC